MTTPVLGNRRGTSAASTSTGRQVSFGPVEARACRALIDAYRDEHRTALFQACAAKAGPKGGPTQPLYLRGPVTRYLEAKALAETGHGPACELVWNAPEQRLVLVFGETPRGGQS